MHWIKNMKDSTSENIPHKNSFKWKLYRIQKRSRYPIFLFVAGLLRIETDSRNDNPFEHVQERCNILHSIYR